MAYIPSSSSVVAFQSDPTKLVGTVSVVGVLTIGNTSILAVPTGNQSVSGTVDTRVIASVATVIIGGSISATFTPPANQSVSGTVGASIIGAPPVTQGGTWIASVFGNVSVLGTVPVTQSGTWIQSIVSTVPSSVLVGASIFGQLPAGTAVLGSVAVLQGTNPWIITGSIQGGGAGTQYLENAITPSVTGTAVMFKSNISSSIMSVVTPQTPLPVSVQGVVTALQGGAPWANTNVGSIITVNQSSSVIAVVTGSVALASSVITVPTGSVITVVQANSIAGTYAEDAAATSGQNGIFTLGVRNDTVSSVTSADGDYGATSVDAVGRMIIKPFAGEDATIISYVGSTVSGSVQLIQASAVGKKSYITDFWLSNTGASNTLVTFQDGSTSILGQFIAPTLGGMVATGLNFPLKTANAQDLAFKVSPSTSVLYLTLKGYQSQ